MATIYGTNGHDNAALGGMSLIGTKNADTIYGYAGSDWLDGGNGNDFLYGGDGVDTILGGKGNDTVVNGTGAGSLDGGAGTDWVDFLGNDSGGIYNLAAGQAKFGLIGSSFAMKNFENIVTGDGNDIIIGTSGKNVIYANGGNDNINAGAGNDTIFGGEGNDNIDGGSGADTLSYAMLTEGVNLYIPPALSDGQVQLLNSGGVQQFYNVEKIIGSKYNDYMQAGATTELDGGAGDDKIISGSGANKLSGGAGNDTLSYSYAFGPVTVNLATGKGSGGSAQGDRISGFENLEGAALDNNTFTGNSGANKLTGGSWDDKFDGGGGADTLIGLSGWDQLKGGSGNDLIDGGASTDWLWGGSGADRFRYTQAVDSPGQGGSMDEIRDFKHSQGDKIDLSALSGSFSFVGTSAFSDDHQVRFQKSGGNTFIQVNVEGDGTPEMVIQLTGSINLQANDFIL